MHTPKRISIGVWIKFELASTFVAVTLRGIDTLEGIPRRLNSMAVLVKGDTIILRDEGRVAARLDEMDPTEVHFGIWPTSPTGEPVEQNFDTYLASDVPVADWLASLPNGAVLYPTWWSATECLFNDKGQSSGMGRSIVEANVPRVAGSGRPGND